VIIANRRKGINYWEGYAERRETEIKEWIDYYRSIGQIVKTFPSMIEYRANCEKLLDKWEAKHSRI
jgi:hypothetical protein